LSTVIVVSFVDTVVLAIGSYILYKLRERRRPRNVTDAEPENVFFERFHPRPAPNEGARA
jgi:hypothetical protein